MNINYISTISNYAIRAVGAALVSIILFSLISMLHGMFGTGEKEHKPGARQQILIEIVKPPQKQETPVKQHIRQIQQAHTDAGSDAENRMSMHFTPDLSVDAGGNGSIVELGKNELSAEVFEEGQTDEPPQEEYMQPPAYDDRMREQDISGTVTASFTVSYDGKANDIRIISSPHPFLSASVKKAIAGAKFRPGKNKGIPVNVRVKKSFQFDLE